MHLSQSIFNLARCIAEERLDMDKEKINGAMDHFFIKAIKNNNFNVVNFLIENVSQKAKDDALMWATKYGYSNIIKLLIQEGANVNIGNIKTAIKHRRPNIAKLLMQHYSIIDDLNEITFIKRKIKYHALSNLIIFLGGMVLAFSQYFGRFPIIGFAVELGLVYKYLIQDVSKSENYYKHYAKKVGDILSPFNIAIKNNDVDTVRILLDNNMPLQIQQPTTCLIIDKYRFAIFLGSIFASSEIMNAYANWAVGKMIISSLRLWLGTIISFLSFKFTKFTEYTYSPLETAVESGSKEIVEEFVKRGANIKVALEYAKEKENDEIIEYLQDAKEKISNLLNAIILGDKDSISDMLQKDPWLVNARVGRKSVKKYMEKYGIDIWMQKNTGSVPSSNVPNLKDDGILLDISVKPPKSIIRKGIRKIKRRNRKIQNKN